MAQVTGRGRWWLRPEAVLSSVRALIHPNGSSQGIRAALSSAARSTINMASCEGSSHRIVPRLVSRLDDGVGAAMPAWSERELYERP